MLTEEQRQESIAFWNQKALDWDALAYDPQQTYQHFPTGFVRQKETVRLCQKHLSQGASLLDIGCATGQLVMDLRQAGFEAHGIDSAPQMIEQAKKNISTTDASIRPETVFRVEDIDSAALGTLYSGISAMGLIEYIKDTRLFLRKVREALTPTGYAFIDSRNRLFNLYSANDYLLKSAEKGDLNDLTRQLADVENYSPVRLSESRELIRTVHQRIGKELAGLDTEKPADKRPLQYPFASTFHQYTPEELAAFGREAQLTLCYVVYYHFHPFIPRYERFLGPLFSKMAVLMQPLGQTPLGATLCSSFIAVFRRD